MLDEHWEQHYGETPPIAHVLRDQFQDRWVRFHSLPEAKRYADSESEEAELLGRSNAVLSHLAADGARLELLTTNWSLTNTPATPLKEVCKLGLSVEHWRAVAMHELDREPDPDYWHVFRSAITWVSGALDNVTRLVADARLSNVMVLDCTSSWLYHPYDGGIDVILGTPEERKRLAADFDAWRSPRPDGL
ncbi:MAG: hypothetical protein AAF266_06760 [Planctomycetota bacterium]